jgi:hypothetical protein
LLLALERQGYESGELRAVAQYEEDLIDTVVTSDDLAYVDDDLETVILEHEAQLGHAEGLLPQPSAEQLAQIGRQLGQLKQLRGRQLTAQLTQKLARHAFRVRGRNDAIRLLLVDQDRKQLAAGFSMGIQFESVSYNLAARGAFEHGPIVWRSTIRAAMMDAEAGMTLRVPGFILRGEIVQPTTTMPPRTYKAKWDELDLDGYLLAWGEIQGDRRCLNCLEPLDERAEERKRFCSERCRNGMKQRRYRERHPEAVDRAQKRYWESVEFDDEAPKLKH